MIENTVGDSLGVAKIILVIACIFLLVIIGYGEIRKYNSEMIETECEIVNKRIERRHIHTGFASTTVYSYLITIELGDISKEISIGNVYYNAVNVGDTGMFNVYYDNKGNLVGIELA